MLLMYRELQQKQDAQGREDKPVTYEARVGADHTVTAASAVHADHLLQSDATWPRVTFGHPTFSFRPMLLVQTVSLSLCDGKT